MIVDLSWPEGTSVNSGIDKDVYLGDDVSLTYPTIDTLTSIIISKGPGALMFKTDLSRAYKQLFVDPRSIHMLAFKWKNCIYIDKTLPFGLRSGECGLSVPTYHKHDPLYIKTT